MEELFIDTEFNGFNGGLLSMAIVDHNGHEFYECVEYDAPLTDWVAQNVILDNEPLSLDEFKTKLEYYLSTYSDGFNLIAD